MKPTLELLASVTIVWGALAFGATYQWASRPLAAVALLFGMLAMAYARRIHLPSRFFVVSSVLVVAAIALQLWPLTPAVLQQWSPSTPALLSNFDVAYATRLDATHPISILPAMTRHGLLLFVAFMCFLVGLARLLSTTGARWLAQGLTIFAVVMALIGIIQKSLFTGKIYGFWTPLEPGSPFGPFVNRNHFAGWMMMALPITLGLLCAGISQGTAGVKPVCRERLLWLGSSAASRLLVLGLAAAVMGLALVLTMSKSGVIAFAVAIALTGLLVVAGVSAHARRTVAVAYLAVLFVTVIGWVGIDTIATNFVHTDWNEFNDRRGAWSDARGIVRAFPMTGTGINTYGTATLFYQHHDLAQHYAQAHNDYLQLLAEGGLLVTIPAVLLVLALAVEIVRRFRARHISVTAWWLRAGAVTGILAVALQETVDFSLQMPGNAVLFAALCAIAIHQPPSITRVRRGEAPR